LPSAEAISQHLVTGCLKSENGLQTDFIQSEIEVKVEPDQYDSSLLDVNELERFPLSPGHVKEEILDHGLQLLPDGLMPPVEMDEDLEIATNSHTSPDKPNRRTGSSSKRKKHTDKQGKRKATNASSHTMRCPTEQSKKMNSNVSSEGIKCLIMQGNATHHPEKSGKTRRDISC